MNHIDCEICIRYEQSIAYYSIIKLLYLTSKKWLRGDRGLKHNCCKCTLPKGHQTTSDQIRGKINSKS